MSDRFRVFNNEELAVLGCGLAFAGALGDLRKEASPLLREVNEEMKRSERKKQENET
jgi:hypothetical protein